MFFEFNQDKKLKRTELLFALFLNATNGIVFSALGYAISNLIIIFIFDNFDIISFKYIMVFVLLSILIFSALMFVFFKTNKGITITENELLFSTGYRSKVFSFNNRIAIDNIVSVECVKDFDLSKTLKSDYKNYNYSWRIVGTNCKNIPYAKIHTKDNIVYLLPVKNINEFIKQIKLS